MKPLSTLLLIALFVSGCTKQIDMVAETEALMQADRDFSSVSESLGTYVAFERFMADSATVLRNRSHPITGHDEIMKLFSPSDSSRLTWEPLFARVARTGDIGYTIGRYDYSAVDSVGDEIQAGGYYITVWERQADGSWKYVFDAGTQGLPEESN